MKVDCVAADLGDAAGLEKACAEIARRGELVCVPVHPDGEKVAQTIKAMAEPAANSSSREVAPRYRA